MKKIFITAGLLIGLISAGYSESEIKTNFNKV